MRWASHAASAAAMGVPKTQRKIQSGPLLANAIATVSTKKAVPAARAARPRGAGRFAGFFVQAGGSLRASVVPTAKPGSNPRAPPHARAAVPHARPRRLEDPEPLMSRATAWNTDTTVMIANGAADAAMPYPAPRHTIVDLNCMVLPLGGTVPRDQHSAPGNPLRRNHTILTALPILQWIVNTSALGHQTTGEARPHRCRGSDDPSPGPAMRLPVSPLSCTETVGGCHGRTPLVALARPQDGPTTAPTQVARSWSDPGPLSAMTSCHCQLPATSIELEHADNAALHHPEHVRGKRLFIPHLRCQKGGAKRCIPCQSVADRENISKWSSPHGGSP